MTDQPAVKFSDLPYDIKDNLFSSSYVDDSRQIRNILEHRLEQMQMTQASINRAYELMMQGNNPAGQQNLINEYTERLMDHQTMVQIYNDRLVRRQLRRDLIHRQITQ